MPTRWEGSWAGGRFYLDGRRTVFVIEKMRAGVRYTIRLDARDIEQAEHELMLFERNPGVFRVPERATPENALIVDATTIQTVLDWQASEGQSVEHRYGTMLYLRQWAQALQGRDLNTLPVTDCERLLNGWKTARKMRVVALKTFCTYHVKRGLLEHNPAARLEVPKTLAAKHYAPRHYEIAEVERAYRATDSQVQRDVIRLACTTGLHLTEIERFSTGVGRLVETPGQGLIAGVLWVLHKSGAQHPNSVDAATLAAARRILGLGGIPARPKRHEYAVRVAAKLGDNVRPVQYGALRHSFITWARSAGGRVVRPKKYGVTLDEIRDVVGHKSTRTTRGYDGTEIPPMITVPVNLEHPSDPKLVEPVGAPRSRASSSPGRRRAKR